ncbi:hypothetical protein CVO96_17360 [Deinococcus koreensis]|uniref:HTH luxR-type domain-containing protein n=2 Tax=Deinococcus koreensis TaxID=2054903 RepID=A0A2K3UT60_9DEIO|nr:LuxR C-terminal-related transcriptional regulator [Deinococcus koreensis]PNY79723.1 hypothetical protein CVO96_17360 [Deinococcus koreensis]
MLIESAVARELGLRDSTSRDVLSRVLTRLEGAHLLLLLDNAEHLPQTAAFVCALLEGAQGVRVLVTSRVPLRLSREREFVLGALPVPRRDSPLREVQASASVQLFQQRARAVQRDFELRPDNAQAVAEICVRLDGLPLAIELAAARIRVLPPVTLLSHLHPALELLTGGPSDRPERQRSLRATLAWSEQLLTPEQRQLLWTLGVFVGGASLADFSAVAGLPEPLALDQLDLLARHSLIRMQPAPDGEERFDLLALIREFALERLVQEGKDHGVRQRHAHHFLEVALRADAELWGARQREALASLEREHSNLRAALGWALQHDPPLALDLVAALGNFWSVHGHFTEGRHWLERALGGEGSAASRVRALSAAGEIARMQGDHGQAERLLSASLTLAREQGDTSGMAAALNLLGVLAHNAARPDEARVLLSEALPLWEAGRRDLGRTSPLFNLGRLSLYWGEAHDAVEPLSRALDFWRGVGNTHGVAYALYSLGRALMELGDTARARQLLRESLDLRRAIGDERGIIASQTALGLNAVTSGEFEAAQPLLSEALTRSVRLGHRRNIAECLEDYAAYAARVGSAAQAVRWCAAAQHLRGMIGAPAAPLDERQVDATLRHARMSLSAAAYDRERRAGTLLGLDAAVQEAQALRAISTTGEPPGNAAFRLSPRELQMLHFLAQGRSNREIAQTLGLSEKTVARHVENVFGKLDVHSRASAVAIAIREGLA